MNANEFFTSNTREQVAKVAREAGTNYNNFRQIALYNGACSGKLAMKLAMASGQAMTTEEILAQRPDKEKTSAA